MRREGFSLIGFQRFLCTETCDWEECPLTRKQTHWHCQEDHCRQFFSDKTRLMRHSERHRRLATIIGEDFQRYSSKVCEYGLDCSEWYNRTIPKIIIRKIQCTVWRYLTVSGAKKQA